MVKRLAALVLALALANVLGCSQDKPAEPNPPHPPESIDELKGAIAKILARNRVPGVGIALVTKDKVIWAG